MSAANFIHALSLTALLIALAGIGLTWWRERNAAVRALQRYRVACEEAERWLCAHAPAGAETARWVRHRGEDRSGEGIERLRTRLVNKAPRAPAHARIHFNGPPE